MNRKEHQEFKLEQKDTAPKINFEKSGPPEITRDPRSFFDPELDNLVEKNEKLLNELIEQLFPYVLRMMESLERMHRTAALSSELTAKEKKEGEKWWQALKKELLSPLGMRMAVTGNFFSIFQTRVIGHSITSRSLIINQSRTA